MPKRVQSPSSINLYKQCPRRYFYQYILRYPSRPNIHCIRGNIVHDALEKFFDINPQNLNSEKIKVELATYLKNLFDAHWNKSNLKLQKLGLDQHQLQFYYDDSVNMLANWLNSFFKDLDKEMASSDFPAAFEKLAPTERELKYKSDTHMVQGYIDAIHKDGDHITILDYKTSKKFNITPEYKLQLGIYALLYQEKHNTLPHKVGIWFLKDRCKTVDVDEQMVKDAKFEIEQVHFSTESKEITDYRRKITPLCRYSTGQCDFYNVCKPHSM
ncbi:PD-(D/E)XK nuclease family protein [Nanoarchaeota archaeon]